MTDTIEIEIISDDDIAYIKIGENASVRTVEVQPDLLVDMDEFGMVVGIEVLALDAIIPFQKLIDDFHVTSGCVDLLRLIQPSVAGFTALRSEQTGSASLATVNELQDA